jgi:two-component system NtrC family sensor kinase
VELVRLTRELNDSLKRETATADVLKVISRSTFDLQPVLDAVCKTAARLCVADMAFMLRRDGDVYRAAAGVGFSPAYRDFLQAHPISPDRGSITGRVVLERRVVNIADVASDPEYTLTEATTLGKVRTQLGVPLLREGEPIGVICLARQRVEPFTQRHIELVRTFAAQAVIAIENARLLNELRHRTADLSQRTTDLTESLEQQTATSEVLRVISTSPSELQPVYSAILANGARLCEALLYENETLRVGAMHNVPDAYAEYRRREPVRVDDPQTVSARVAATKEVVHVLDYAAEMPDNPVVRLGGARSAVAVPMLKENELLGAMMTSQAIGDRPRLTWNRVFRSLGSDVGRALRTCGGEAIWLDTADAAHERHGIGWHSKQKPAGFWPTGGHSTPSINLGSLLLWRRVQVRGGVVWGIGAAARSERSISLYI